MNHSRLNKEIYQLHSSQGYCQMKFKWASIVVFVLLLVLIIIQVTVFSPCNGIIEDYEVKVIFEEWKLI